MNQRLVSGVFVLAISLALVGFAVTAQGGSATEVEAGRLESAVVSAQTPDMARAQVPLRSAFLENQASGVDPASMPVAVRIGGIGLEAPVISVGVDEQHEFDVPTADKVGWYRHSSTPGSAGSTVLAAHVDYGGEPGAFFNLAAVEIDDLLEVEMADGTTMQYRVIETVLYDKTELPADDLFRKEGDSVLQLITCGGTFDAERRSYRGNVVVTALPISA